MPTYQYRCAKCGEDLEVYQSFSDAPLKRHSGCGGKLTKVLAPVGVVLKGPGFYKTDHGSSARSRTKERARSEGTDGRSDTATSDGAASKGGEQPASKPAEQPASKPASKAAAKTA